MTGQIRGMRQAMRNANDGISMAQTAEGALGEVANMLHRIRELAVRSASGTYSDDDRTNMQAEVIELTGQILSIPDNTKLNGVTLVDGSAGASGDVTIQTGSNADETVTLTLRDVNLSDAIGSDISDAGDASDALKTLTTRCLQSTPPAPHAALHRVGSSRLSTISLRTSPT
jgi:flagellin